MNATDTKSLERLPKNIYLDYIKLFPVTKTEEIKTYTTLILTLLAVIGFSIFAINPTLKTIIELRRTREDNQIADTALQNKIAAMQSLQHQYANLGNSLARISEAIPTDPDAPTLLAKIQTLAQARGITVTRLEAQEVALTKQSAETKPSSFVVNVTATGVYTQVVSFLEALHSFDRVVTIESIAITRDEQGNGSLTANIRLRAYFHPESGGGNAT